MTGWPDGYAVAPGLRATAGRYALRPIRWEDRTDIRRWRNDQLDVLRQAQLLSEQDQDRYFSEVVAPQMTQNRPAQVLVAYTEDDVLVGYGGVVHIDWPDRRGELSFLTDRARALGPTFGDDWLVFIGLLARVGRDLGLHRLTTETYSFRSDVIDHMRRAGFVHEGTLREHHIVDGLFVDSLLHGLILEP